MNPLVDNVVITILEAGFNWKKMRKKFHLYGGSRTRHFSASKPLRYLKMVLAAEPDEYLEFEISRTSSRSVHEHTLTVDYRYFDFDEDNNRELAQLGIPDVEALNKDVDLLGDECLEIVKELSVALYASLEEDYTSLTGDESVGESLEANEVTFDEDGDPDPDGEFGFEQLSAESKTKALEVNRDWNISDPDWHEATWEMWKEDLEAAGFEDVEMRYSGFWSQGDGASITCTIDARKFLKLKEWLEQGDDSSLETIYNYKSEE